MRVLVIGATGFIGQHLCQALSDQGHEIRALTRNAARASELLQIDDCVPGDLDQLDQLDFEHLMTDIESVIFAAGVDERAEIVGDVDDFYYQYNIAQCLHIMEKAKQYGIKQFTVLGSVFTYWHRQRPDLNLDGYHPYVRSRLKQQQACLECATDDFQVCMVEVPLVLGRANGVTSVANTLVQYARLAYPIFSVEGGMAAISVSSLAEALAKLQELETLPEIITISDENILWHDLIAHFNQMANNPMKPVKLIKSGLFLKLTQLGGFFANLLKIEGGLDQMYMADIVNSEIFCEADEAKQLIGYEGGDLYQSISDTVEAAMEEKVTQPLINTLDQGVSALHKLSVQMRQRFETTE